MALPWDVMLCDIDGTLTFKNAQGKNEALPGAVAAINVVQRYLPVVYVTNTTSLTRAFMAAELVELGFPCHEQDLYSPVVMAEAFMKATDMTTGIGFFAPSSRSEFAWFTSDPEHGKAVLVADEGLDVTFRQVEQAFRLLMNGAKLFSLQKNRFYRTAEGLKIDLGPLTAALEYAADQPATVFGKPSPLLFECIAAIYRTSLTRMVIVGDDPEFDIKLPMATGLAGILIKTGKFRPDVFARLDFQPTHTLAALTELPALIEGSR